MILKGCFIAQLFSALSAVFLFGWAFVWFVLVWLSIIFAFHSRRLHTTPEEFENGGFTLKSLQVFFLLSTLHWKNMKTQQLPVIWICVWGKHRHGNFIINFLQPPSYQKVSFTKCFHSETQSLRFQILPVWRAFSKFKSSVFVAD